MALPSHPITHEQNYLAALLAEVQGIKALLAELLALLKSERKPDEKPVH